MDSANSMSSDFTSEDKQLVAQLGRTTAIGEELVGNADRRMLWLEMLKTVNSALPQTPGVQPGEIPDVDKLPFQQREEIHVEQLEVQHFDKLEDWFTELVKNKYIETQTVARRGRAGCRQHVHGLDGTSASRQAARPTGPHG